MATVVTLVLAVLLLALIARVTGDETIGFGGKIEINDGVADAFVVVPKVEALGIPDETTGTVESKPLDLPEAVIRKLATIHNGGSITIKIQLLAATRTRLETIRKTRKPKHFRFTVPIDEGELKITVPGIITSNKIEDLESEKINVINCTVEVSGPRVTADTVTPVIP